MSDRDRGAVEGIAVVDKPAGMTSHDVVDEVRRRFKTKKVGHAGTLDPDATGVLIIGIGRATRLLTFTQEGPKRYRARVKFGVTTSTQDASGEVISERVPDFSEEDLRGVIDRFTGVIDQVPPMVSAVKVGGERLYKKARRGEEVDRSARTVTIYSLELINVDLEDRFADLDVECSGGTYIRTLAHDIGEALGCGAHLAALRRTAAGGFTEADLVALDALGESHLRPLGAAVGNLPRLDLEEEAARAVAHGQPLPLGAAGLLDLANGDRVALFHEDDLLGIYVRREDSLAAERVLAA